VSRPHAAYTWEPAVPAAKAFSRDTVAAFAAAGLDLYVPKQASWPKHGDVSLAWAACRTGAARPPATAVAGARLAHVRGAPRHFEPRRSG
jgi:hypothetical protein